MRTILNPAYLHRPSQIVRRARTGARHGEVTTRLPWGHAITFSVDELVGACVARRGVIELGTTELIWRLVAAGDAAVDVGANFGYFTSLLMARGARVDAFEPHPDTYALLAVNARRWPGEMRAHRLAVSDKAGPATLHIPEDFEKNNGVATLAESIGTGLEVEATTLDDVIAGPVGLVKIDVEGHEPAVLRGAARALRHGLVRDVIFEEHHSAESQSIPLLREHGYSLFGIHETRRGVELVDPESPEAIPHAESPNCLATLEPERALGRVGRGWLSLRGRTPATD